MTHLEVLASDWVVWFDADLMVANHEQPLDAFLGGGKDLVLGEDMADLDWLNTGLLMCRTSSAWARGLWGRVWEFGSANFHQGEFWDQSALCGCLADWGEFRPDVVGGKKTGAPTPSTPWFSWQGGLRSKETEHLDVISAGALQTNNPRFAQFAFHAAGMKDKLRSSRHVCESGAVRGLGVTVAAEERCGASGGRARWAESFGFLRQCVLSGRPFVWGWPAQHRQTWAREKALPWLVAAWDGASPAVAQAPAPGWSLASLRDGPYAELPVAVEDRSPGFADDPLPAGKPLSFRTGVRLWEAVDFALGFPPSQHGVLREMDESRLWRTAWRPWRPQKTPAGEPVLSPPSLKLSVAGLQLAVGRGAAQEASVEVAPPGAVLRLHQPANGQGDWLLWQLEGAQQVALLLPSAAKAVQQSGQKAPTLHGSHSRYDPWVDESAEVVTAVLRSGEALLVPRGWWLTARALQPSLSVACAHGELVPPQPHMPKEPADLGAVKRVMAQLGAKAVHKEVLRPGSGPRAGASPRFIAVCHANYFVGVAGKLARSTRVEGGPQVFFPGADRSLGALEGPLRTMLVGESALVAVAAPEQGGALVVELELLAAKPHAERAAAERSACESYLEAWWTWFGEPAGWRPLVPARNAEQDPPCGQVCSRCGCSGAALRCSRCQAAAYCCKPCQREAWPEHRALCAQL